MHAHNSLLIVLALFLPILAISVSVLTPPVPLLIGDEFPMLLIWGLALTIRSLCTCMNEHIEKKGKGTPHKLNRELN